MYKPSTFYTLPLFLITLLISSLSFANFDFSNIEVTGRYLEKQSKKEPYLAYSWPGISIATQISAKEPITDLSIDLSGDQGFYQLDIFAGNQAASAGHQLKLATQSGRKSYLIPISLPAGEYQLRLTKIGENTGPHLRFYGFQSQTPVTFSKPKSIHKKRIQFFTDSHGVGYGNESPKRQCTQQERLSTTNHLKAYPQITAQLLTEQGIASESFSQSFSGIGVVRNWGGEHLYRYDTFKDSILLDQPELSWDYSKDRADLIVIELGHNDFSTPLNSVTKNEKWSSQNALAEDWLTQTKILIRQLQKDYQRSSKPIPVIAMATYLSSGDRQRPMVQQLVSELEKEMPIEYLDYAKAIPKQTGCHGHPTVTEQIAIAKMLTEKTRALITFAQDSTVD